MQLIPGFIPISSVFSRGNTRIGTKFCCVSLTPSHVIVKQCVRNLNVGEKSHFSFNSLLFRPLESGCGG